MWRPREVVRMNFGNSKIVAQAAFLLIRLDMDFEVFISRNPLSMVSRVQLIKFGVPRTSSCFPKTKLTFAKIMNISKVCDIVVDLDVSLAQHSVMIYVASVGQVKLICLEIFHSHRRKDDVMFLYPRFEVAGTQSPRPKLCSGWVPRWFTRARTTPDSGS